MAAPVAPRSAEPSAAESSPRDAAAQDLPDAGAARLPAVTVAEAEDVLFLDAPTGPDRAACHAEIDDDDARVRCLLGLRFGADSRGRGLALGLFATTGSVVGLAREQMFDGGWRGTIRLVPELPSARHLSYLAAALAEHDRFFMALGRVAPSPPRYRWRALQVRVFRSVSRTTPSAYASGWTIAYNVAGSINGSADAVRETLFHEVFHLNDEAHGGWSPGALSPIQTTIVARCGARTACLAPYAPGDTLVRGGTYYAFQPGNPVEEYAAEVALRYYREQRVALGAGEAGARATLAPFKCGPAENARAWRLVRDEFFGGADASPACLPPPRRTTGTE